MAKVHTTTMSEESDTTRTAKLKAFESAFLAIQWGADDAAEQCKDPVGQMLASLIVNDLEATIQAIKAKRHDLHLEALSSDADRLTRDCSRCGLEREGPGIVLLLDFLLGQIKAVA